MCVHACARTHMNRHTYMYTHTHMRTHTLAVTYIVFIALVGCFVVNILHAVGFFGFCGGITNWIAVELFFVKIPLIYGRCVIV